MLVGQLNITDIDTDPSELLITITVQPSNGQLGVIVDSVREVHDLTDESIEASPTYGSSDTENQFLIGIGKLEDLVIVLIDLTDGLSPDERQHIDEINDVLEETQENAA